MSDSKEVTEVEHGGEIYLFLPKGKHHIGAKKGYGAFQVFRGEVIFQGVSHHEGLAPEYKTLPEIALGCEHKVHCTRPSVLICQAN